LQQGAYVLAYDEVKPPEQMTFEAVKSKLQIELTTRKANELRLAKAKELRTKIEEVKKTGKTFYEAAESLGRKPVPFPVFGGMARPPQTTKYLQQIPPATRKLAPGQLSDPITVDDAAIVVHLDQRTAGDEKSITAVALNQSAQMLERQMRGAAFQDWLNERSNSAGVNSQTFR
jgi:parvulin-like peptidyl-prolyl isomerase